MSENLVGVRQKIRWAEEHLAQFDESFSHFKGTSAYSVRHLGHEEKPDGVSMKFSITCSESLPDWSLHVGDCVHNLRCALDHLACLLATRAGHSSACDTTQFPIGGVDDATIQRKIRDLAALCPAGAEAVLQRAQPYQRRPSDPFSDPLYLLNKLDNIDKHRFMLGVNPKFADAELVMRVNGEAKPPVSLSGVIPDWTPLKTDTVFFRLTSRGAPPKDSTVDVDIKAAVSIVFANTGLKCDGSEARAVTQGIIDATKGVVADFETEFFA